MPKTTDRILTAYHELVYQPGDWVSLTRLRAALADVPRAELDAGLRELFMADQIKLIGEVNQRSLTSADRAAALVLGGDEKHLYRNY